MAAIGQVVEVIPVVDTAIYASGDQLALAMTLTPVSESGGRELAVLDTVVITDSASQSAALDILFFDESPTVASSVNAAANVSDAEMADKCIGYVSIAAADYKALSANSVATVKNIKLALKTRTANTIYALVVSRGTPTYAAASDLTFKFTFL